jgi:ferric-dicitrate binding protein FerR (iron transport regulator)
MTDKDDNWVATDEARLARLMRAVPRATPDPAARARAFDAVQAEWQAQQALRAPRTAHRRWTAAAAAVVLAAGAALWMRPVATPAIASLDRVHGAVIAAGAPLAVGATLRGGATLETAADSGALLRYSAGLTLRLDAGTRVTLVDAATLRLGAGQVYVDIAPGTAGDFTVQAAGARVRHLGTRYAVDARGDALRIAVREGAVEVDLRARPERAVAGEMLLVRPGEPVVRSFLAADDPQWDWLARLPTPVDIEGASLADFLRWYADETGRAVDYVDADTRARAASAVLHGSVAGLTPAEALAIVMASVDLAAEPRSNGIVVGPAHH